MKCIPKLSLVFLACVASVTAAAETTLEKVARTGEITLSYRESSAPFSYLDGNKPIGFSWDIANKVVDQVKQQLKKPDLKIKTMAVTSQNRIPLVQNGTVDLECGSTTNSKVRQQDVTFGINHFYTSTKILVRGDSGIKGYGDIKGKSIAATTGTSNLLTMRRYSAEHKLDLNLVQVKDHSEAILLVENQRAAGFATDDVLLYSAKAMAKDPAMFEVVGDALNPEPYGCMLRKDDSEFKQLVNGVIKNLMASGEFETLYNKWFLNPIPPMGKVINIPMSQELRDNMTKLSDQPLS